MIQGSTPKKEEKPEVLYGEIQGVVGYWYPEMDMDMWLKPILKQAETLRFLFGEEGVKTANLERIQIWREKAEKWDSFFEKPEARVRAVELLLEAGKKLEAIKTAFPVLKSYIEIGDKIGITSSIEVIEEILEADDR